MSRARYEKAVREHLATLNEHHLALSVIKALEEKGHEPDAWVPQLQEMQRLGDHLLFFERAKKRWATDSDEHMVESLADLENMQAVMQRVADMQHQRYSPQDLSKEARTEVYASTERMARGALVGIAQSVDGLGVQLMDMVFAHSSMVERFDFQVGAAARAQSATAARCDCAWTAGPLRCVRLTSAPPPPGRADGPWLAQVRAATSHLTSVKELCGTAGMKKLRAAKDDPQQAWPVEEAAVARPLTDVPLPCFAKCDTPPPPPLPVSACRDGSESCAGP